MADFLSLRKGEIRNFDSYFADKLIDAGVAREYNMVEVKVERVTGTLAFPFGDVDLAKLFEALQNRTATAYIHNSSALEEMIPASDAFMTSNNDGEICVFSGYADSEEDYAAETVIWNALGLKTAQFVQNGTFVNIKEYAWLIPTELTIVWTPYVND